VSARAPRRGEAAWAPREIDGAVLNLVERPGPPGAPLLLLIHSLGCDLRIWDAVAASLSAVARVAAYDLRGHGLSSVTPGADLSRHAADALALIQALGARRAILCGISIGGQIAMEAALAAPGRVRGLVLMDTAARIGNAGRYAERARRIRQSGIAAIAPGQVERWFAPEFRARAPGIVAAMQAMLERQPVEGYLAGVAAVGATDLGARPAAIACPTLCLAGEHDVSTAPDAVAALATLVGAEMRVIEGAGHLPPVEAPDATADAVARFVRACA
jgi:3-oxoadipate enol-lactonase